MSPMPRFPCPQVPTVSVRCFALARELVSSACLPPKGVVLKDLPHQAHLVRERIDRASVHPTLGVL